MKIENENKKYDKDDSVIYSCQYHVIFCPKYRRKVLVDEVKDRFCEIVYRLQKEYSYSVLELNVMPDHVHLLVSVNPKIGIYKVVCRIKGISSREIRKEFDNVRKRIPTLWTRSCFISSVGYETIETIKRYIENQTNI